MRHIKSLMLAVVVALSSVLAPGSHAKKVVDIYELTLDDNLEVPKVDDKRAAQNVAEYQYDVAVRLKKHNLDVETMRDNQVIVITIPASTLFAPNDTALTTSGKTFIKPLLPFLKNPGLYKMLLVMHSDDTGSHEYTVALTRSRVNAVYDWIDANASVDFVVPYALGDTDPIVENDSMEKRKRNRRLEIFLVPEEKMVELAKKGKISINVLN